ncbi:sister chromatid cohesion protein PDS5 homolog B-like [Zingiber officinale]|uniref:sister chromatid cohesion protein PDS5 homolog B-like n=1 Tax=Zingiber officinale TaxID=94328 RepID=UPI001C4DC191|nr:sister chromatid cohesion protein PDS5 homolog B-like [Zingiber officinale]
MAEMAQKLQQQLKEVGSKLESPPASKDALIKLLKQAANCLSELEQSPSPSVSDSMQSCVNAFAQKDLLTHQDRDVKVLVATCVCEITRITAPDAPYSDDVLRDIFHLIVGTFAGLGDIDSPSYERRVVILETVAKYRSCVVMLDLECNDLIQEMFRTFVSVISDDHPQNIFTSMQTIMILILDESEELQENLILILLSVLGCKVNGSSMAARRLAMNVIERCAGKLEPFIKQFLVSSLSGDGSYLNYSIDHHEVIYDLYQCAPQILARIIPYITGELLTDKLDIRLKAVQLLGKLFSLPEVPVSEAFQSVFDEFLKRLTDRVVEVRLSVIDHLKNCLVTNPERPEAPLIIKALSDRVLDYDEKVRKKVVAAVYDVACHSFKVIPMEIASFVAERLRDKSLTVKKYTMERLVDLHQLYCLKSSDGSTNLDDCKWIPGKILKCGQLFYF